MYNTRATINLYISTVLHGVTVRLWTSWINDGYFIFSLNIFKFHIPYSLFHTSYRPDSKILLFEFNIYAQVSYFLHFLISSHSVTKASENDFWEWGPNEGVYCIMYRIYKCIYLCVIVIWTGMSVWAFSISKQAPRVYGNPQWA